MNTLGSLNREQKEAIGLLQIGTFLEYFDLMLYVHMAVLLNELFFPKTDPHTAALLSAFAFCSTFCQPPRLLTPPLAKLIDPPRWAGMKYSLNEERRSET